MNNISANIKMILISIVVAVCVIFAALVGIQGSQNHAISLEEIVEVAQSDINVQEKRLIMTDEIEIIEDEEEEFYLFKELFKGDIFKDGKGDYHMRVGEKDWVNTINLETGSFSCFPDEARVYPFKKVKITVYK